MFNNGKTGETPNGASSSQPPASQLMSANSKTTVSTHSVVDECLTMKGDLESEGNILVKGKVFGNIKCQVLIVDVDAFVEGGIEANEVVIRGKTNGKIQAKRVRLEKTADVDSEICHNSLSVEEGARIRGTLHLNEEPLGDQTKTVKAKAATRNMSAVRPTKDVTNGQLDEVGSGGA